MGLNTRNKVSVNYSMSSLTDIVFLLLIFFIIISTMISPNALNVRLPESSAKTTAKQNASVTITEDHRYFINGKEEHIANLESKLSELLTGQDKPGIILHADKSVPLEYAVKVMDIANRNKYELVLATKPPQ